MIRSATFSEDRNKRFDLVRDWRDEVTAPDRTVMFGMLNPSKAGEKDDDPTVRKVVGFARLWGFGRAVLVNLSPVVSTDPWGLPYFNGIDMENRAIVQQWMGEVDLVVAAWGSPSRALCHKISFGELVYLFRKTAPVDLYCIGKTKDGSPLHPSRAPYTSNPILWKRNGE